MYFRFPDLLRVLLVLSSYYLSIQRFRYAFSVAIFSSKNVRSLWPPVVATFLCHALPVVSRISFRCFGMPFFVCIVLPFVYISLMSLLSPELLVYFLKLYSFFSRVVFSTQFPHITRSFRFTVLPCFRRFSSAFPVDFPSWFWQFLRAYWGDPDFSHTNFDSA